MSEPYQILAFSKEGLPAEEMVTAVDAVLRAAGGVIDDDCLLTLAETATAEPDPEEIEDPDDALARLRAWPTLGSISYSMPESVVNVAFRKDAAASRVHFCKISILQSAIDNGGEEVRQRYGVVARELFNHLRATRVIFDWGLEYNGLDWQQELTRLQRGEFQGTFDLDLHS